MHSALKLFTFVATLSGYIQISLKIWIEFTTSYSFPHIANRTYLFRPHSHSSLQATPVLSFLPSKLVVVRFQHVYRSICHSKPHKHTLTRQKEFPFSSSFLYAVEKLAASILVGIKTKKKEQAYHVFWQTLQTPVVWILPVHYGIQKSSKHCRWLHHAFELRQTTTTSLHFGPFSAPP